jgi:hypothetical protein
MSAAAHHREQLRSNTCVPASACIVSSWLGAPRDEAWMCEHWAGSKKGYAIEDACLAIGGVLLRMYPEQPSFHDHLRARLEEGRWILAYVFSAPMMRFALAMTPPPRSRFGPLSTAPYGELHTIVLVGADAAGFEYLDPYYPVDGQPFRLSDEQIAEAWQGSMIVSPAPSGS